MPLRAAGISYYVFLALIPLLTTIVSIALAVSQSRVGSEKVIFYLTRWLLPEAIHDVKEHVQTLAENAAIVSVASIAFAIYCLVKIIFFFEESLKRIWKPEERPMSKGSPLKLAAKATAILVSLVIVISLGMVTSGHGLASSAVEIMSTWLCFIGFNKILVYQPDWKRVLPGSIVGGVVWYGTKWAFTAYIDLFARPNQFYAILGILPLLFLWLHFSVVILLMSACFNYAIRGQVFDRSERR